MLFLKHFTQNFPQKAKPLSLEFHLLPSYCSILGFFIGTNSLSQTYLYSPVPNLLDSSFSFNTACNFSEEFLWTNSPLVIWYVHAVYAVVCKMIHFTVLLSSFFKFCELSWLAINAQIHKLSFCELWFWALHNFCLLYFLHVVFGFCQVVVLPKW